MVKFSEVQLYNVMVMCWKCFPKWWWAEMFFCIPKKNVFADVCPQICVWGILICGMWVCESVCEHHSESWSVSSSNCIFINRTLDGHIFRNYVCYIPPNSNILMEYRNIFNLISLLTLPPVLLQLCVTIYFTSGWITSRDVSTGQVICGCVTSICTASPIIMWSHLWSDYFC